MNSKNFQPIERRIISLLTMAMSVDAKLLKQTKFPAEFSQKVDMRKVNVEVMKKYAWSTLVSKTIP